MIGNHDNDDRPGNYKVDMPEASFFTGPKESNLRTVSRLKDFQWKKIWQPGLDVWSQKNERCTCVGSLWGRKWRMSWTLSHHSDCSLATTLNGDDGDGHHSDDADHVDALYDLGDDDDRWCKDLERLLGSRIWPIPHFWTGRQPRKRAIEDKLIKEVLGQNTTQYSVQYIKSKSKNQLVMESVDLIWFKGIVHNFSIFGQISYFE